MSTRENIRLIARAPFLFIIYNFKRNIFFFAVNDAIHVRTLCHINDDLHNVQ